VFSQPAEELLGGINVVFSTEKPGHIFIPSETVD